MPPPCRSPLRAQLSPPGARGASPGPEDSCKRASRRLAPLEALFPLSPASRSCQRRYFREQRGAVPRNALSVCSGRDTLICPFLVSHQPEKDPGSFREGARSLALRESLLCRALISPQKQVLLVF